MTTVFRVKNLRVHRQWKDSACLILGGGGGGTSEKVFGGIPPIASNIQYALLHT